MNKFYKKWEAILCLLTILILIGCNAIELQDKGRVEDLSVGVKAVAEGLTGKAFTDEEVRELERKMQSDEETQTAIQSISGALLTPKAVKYCPMTGKRYAVRLQRCPVHDVDLKSLK